jgi:hypothetical protein
MAGTNPAMTQLQSPRVASPALATSKRRRQARRGFSMLVRGLECDALLRQRASFSTSATLGRFSAILGLNARFWPDR